MSVIKYFHMHRFLDASWLLLFALSLFFLYRMSKEYRTRRVLLIFVVINILIVYCPLTAKLLVPFVFPSGNEYERLSWTFFIIPIISFALLQMSMSAWKTGQKWAVLLIVVLLFFTTNRFSEASFVKPENIYKIPEESIELVEILDKDVEARNLLIASESGYRSENTNITKSENHGNDAIKWAGSMSDGTPRIVVAMQMSPLEVVSDDMSYNAEVYYGIRQYTSRYPLEMVDVDSYKAEYRTDYAVLDITKIDSDYIILENDEVFNELVPRIGFLKVDETENFVLYRKYNAQ